MIPKALTAESRDVSVGGTGFPAKYRTTPIDGIRFCRRHDAGSQFVFGLAAGAMLFVVSHEVIPETHHNGHQTFTTPGLTARFALMMTLDTVLG